MRPPAYSGLRSANRERPALLLKPAYSEVQKSRSAALKREAAIKKLSRPQKDKLVAKR